MTPEQIARQLGADLADLVELPAAEGCPRCGRDTIPAPSGQHTYCLPCTEAELPGTALDNSLRIEARLTWAGYWRRLEKYGTPWSNPKAWTTKHSRRR